MKRIGYILIIALVTLSSCGGNAGSGSRSLDTPTSGVIDIAVDETIAPVIDQEIDIFEHLYPKASIVPRYRSEKDVFKLLIEDSLRLAIAPRDFTIAEKRYLKDKVNVRSYCLAIDAIALIINKENPDSILTVSQVKDILTGKITSWKDINPKSELDKLSLTFDNEGSSTVRFALDSICKGEPFAKENIYAQGTNEKVIDYVAASKGAIGVIGASWIGNKNDSTNLSFNDRITVMGISSDRVATPTNSYKPYQAYIALGQYPFIRRIYVLDISSRDGLAKGFSNFLSKDKGQLVILKSGMLPQTQQVRIKPVKITD